MTSNQLHYNGMAKWKYQQLLGFEIDVVSRVTLPAWPGQGYGRHWLFFRALSPICILSVAGRSIVFKVIWIFVLYICIFDSLSRGCIYICSVGPIEDCCVMLLLRFPPARKCPVGTFESFLCGFGGKRWNLHRADSEGVTEWYQSSAVTIPHKSSL